MAPNDPDPTGESNLTIGAKTMKEMMEHFQSKGTKSDPQLVWTFKEGEVELKTLEAAIG
jgi:cell cycle checkpoint control protein RAD9A